MRNVLSILIRLIGEGKKIISSDSRIQTAIYKLKQDYPEIFEDYLFDINGHYPRSEEVIDELAGLKLSGFLSLHIGTAPYEIRVGDGNLEDLKNRRILEQIAREFYSLVKVE